MMKEVLVLIAELQAPDAGTRLAAAKALADAGRDAPEAVSALFEALGDKDRRVRKAAARSLGCFRSSADEAWFSPASDGRGWQALGG